MVSNREDDITSPLLGNHVKDYSSMVDPSPLINKPWFQKFTSGPTETSSVDNQSFKTTSFFRLFQFADKRDLISVIIGFIAAVVQGFLLPWSFYLMGSLSGVFAQHMFDQCQIISTAQCPLGIEMDISNYDQYHKFCTTNSTTTKSIVEDSIDFPKQTRQLIVQLILLACTQFIASGISHTAFMVSSKRQTNRMRQRLFRRILNKNLTYFDTHTSTEWYSQLLTNIDCMALGIGDKLAMFISTFLSAIFGVLIGLFVYWPVALIQLIIVFLGFFLMSGLWKVMSQTTVYELRAYGKADGIAQEALSALRTVLANNAIGLILNRYANCLDSVRDYTMKKSVMLGLIHSLSKFMLYGIAIVGIATSIFLFRQSAEQDEPSIGHILIILIANGMCLFFIMKAVTYSMYMIEARSAAVDVFAMFDEHELTNDNESDDSKQLLGTASFDRIDFTHVIFAYPSRPDVHVLHDVNFTVKKGESVALVGHSGSGKSSCVQLLTRLYEVTTGMILLDDINIMDYDREWLREHIAVVSQDTAMFSTSIFNNIQYGNVKATREEIIEAAKQANAHSFIMTLPDKYETRVGQRGFNLSGGERQRIVLARAIVQQAPILLLDEPTNALDHHSERLFQQALEQVSQNRITLIIAHRLSTIRRCSRIYVMDHGHIVESGDHDTLMACQTCYFKLVQAQQQDSIDEIQANLSIDDKIATHTDTFVDDMDRTPLDHTETTKNNDQYPFLTLLKLARPEYGYIIVGIITCFICGGLEVCFALGIGYTAAALEECHVARQHQRIKLICLAALLLAFITFVFNFLAHYSLGIPGAAFIKRLRTQTLAAFFRQEVAWHDREENNSAALCARLCTNADDVKRLIDIRLLYVLHAVGSVIIGSVIGFLIHWQLMFIVLIEVLVYAVVVVSVTYIDEQTNIVHNQIMEKATTLSVECISNIRTVRQLRRTNDFSDQYNTLIDTTFLQTRTICIIGLLSAVRHSLARFAIGVLYVVALKLVDVQQLRSNEMSTVFTYACYIITVTTLTDMAASEIGRTRTASRNFVQLFQRQSLIDSEATNGQKPKSFNGEIHLDKVSFSYPTRRHAKVLDHLSLQANRGQTVALVGPSGCGKSSIIQLLTRFYDVDHGSVFIDGVDIRSLNVDWWRSQLALVNQDPVLFDTTIRENILFGCQHRSEPLPTMNEIIEIAKLVNIHDFICSLPQNYETNVGVNGTQLSGGQKQRIVIARSLLRRAKLLLLDEVTSALDTINEQIIQQAIEQAHREENCTTIIVAHRLSTIRQCDFICVFDDLGQIIEYGTHETLVALRGVYYQMTTAVVR